jgi:DNA-binding LacI/PurR family transcriptional regulator
LADRASRNARGGRDGRRGVKAPGDRSGPVTMRDIAEITGLSQSTVSRVLSGTPTLVPISEDSRERVLAAAKKLQYRPNPLARGLRGASTMLLGLIVREITDPFFAGAIEAVTVEAAQRDYNVVLGAAHARADEAIALWGVLEARHCDAILLLGDMRDQPRLVADLATASVPVVALWQGSEPSEVAAVSVDNAAGIHALLDHLVDLGHRRIAFVGGVRLGDIEERHDAFLEHMTALGIEVPEGYAVNGPNDLAAGVAALHHLADLPDPPTAVVASSDVLAIGLLRGAAERGIRVPEDMSISGFDDIPQASYTVPALTTVCMPVGEMVRTAVQLALGPAAGDAAPADEPLLVVQPTLVVRESTGPARER